MTILVLAFVYIAVLTPIGLLLRLRGHRLRESAPDSKTFWVDCGEPAETSQYFHTY